MITFDKLSIQDLKPSSMLVSRDKNLIKAINTPKVLFGRFLTTGDNWLSPQVRDFILEVKPRSVLDPFAGNGDLLKQVGKLVPNATLIGMDIQEERWIKNDSLLAIPRRADLIVTNPPFWRNTVLRERVYGPTLSFISISILNLLIFIR